MDCCLSVVLLDIGHHGKAVVIETVEHQSWENAFAPKQT